MKQRRCGLCTNGAFLGASLSDGRELGLGEAVEIVRVEGAISLQYLYVEP